MKWNAARRLIPLFALLSIVLAGCGKENLSALDPKGPVASEQLWLILLSVGIMTLVLVVVFVLYAYVLVKFRDRKGQTGYPKQVEGNHKLEIIWTVIPFVLLMILGVPTIASTFSLDKNYAHDPDALQIKVTGHQFWWEFEYMEDKIVTAQDLYIPTGRTISFHLESADVMHSFWVPALGGKKDTNPGITNMLFLKADEPGVYFGKCAELCGASHALMDFKVIAVSPEEYDRWIAQMKAPTSVAAASEGEQIFKQSCIGCHAVYDREAKAIGGGKMGPSLVNYGNRSTVAGIRFNYPMEDKLLKVDQQLLKNNLKEWLMNPQKVKPGNRMPNPVPVENSRMEQNLGLNEKQIDALVEYLSSMK
jgi:cytochrome c oxidase subunit II